jgi:hypothetical protein
MVRMGRPREKYRDMPLGFRLVDGRWYWRPTDIATRLVCERIAPGRKSVPVGAEKAAARMWWAKNVLPALDAVLPENLPPPGTVAEIVERYERDILPEMHPKTKVEHTRYCKSLLAAFGVRRYAKSEAEASTGSFVRSIDVTRYLRAEAKRQVFRKVGDKQILIADGRPVAANKEIQCLSRMFRLAKTEWGYTEYNPCLQVEYNVETPRDQYHDDATFMKVYEKAPPVLQCMMDLAQMHAARRGMLLKLSLACLGDDGILLPLNKKRKNDPQRFQLIKWSDDLRDVVNRALEIRKKVRGGQKEVDDLATAPLFLNRLGKAFSETGFNSIWQRARKSAGFGTHEFHFHDIKAKSVSDSPDEIDAMNRGGHLDMRTTKRVYRRKPTEIIPLPRVSGKRG